MKRFLFILAAALAVVSVSCKKEVQKTEVTGVKISLSSLGLTVEETQTLSATVEPADAADKTLIWSSSNESVATVDQNGNLTAVAPGEATVTVKSKNGKSQYCKVTVKAREVPVESVTLLQNQVTIVEGDKGLLTATVAPENATDKSKIWSSSNESVATVDQNGNLTAVSPGTATITVRTVNGKEDICTVTVSPKEIPVESITLTPVLFKELNVHLGYTDTIGVIIEPENATNKTIVWTSDDPDIATVDENGVVTAISPGSVVITATTHNGLTDTKTVHVIIPYVLAESVTITPTSEISIYVGETVPLTATVLPENATDKTITWTSSHPYVAKIDSDGLVTAVSPGSIYMTATTSNGKSAMKYVTVSSVSVSGISIYTPKVLLNSIGESMTISATVIPVNASNKNITWTIDNTDVVKIMSQADGSCTVKAFQEGYAILTAKTQDGNKTATAYLTVGTGENYYALSKNNFYISCCSIEGSSFLMGSPADVPGVINVEKPQHTVTLDDYYMSKYEITCYQFAEFLNSVSVGGNGVYNGNKLLESVHSGITYVAATRKWVVSSGLEHCPVVWVSWHGASEFASWAGGRLPTEAEWEYACRAGTTTPYFFGNTSDGVGDYAWYNANSSSKIRPVGKKIPNAWGLYDILGNVEEWCFDWLGYYSDEAQNNPTGPDSSYTRVLRGGSIASSADFFRSSNRYGASPSDTDSRRGFRIVIEK